VDAVSEQAVDLSSTWAVMRRRSRVLLSAAVVGGLAGLGALFVFPPPYSSTSVVLLPAAAQAGSGKTGEYDADTQILIATSAEVLARAAQEMQPELTQEQVTDRVAVEAPATSIVRITAEGPTDTQAEDLARGVADSLKAYLEESTRALSSTQQAALQERLDTLTASLDAVNAEIKKAEARIAKEGTTSAAGLADAAALSDLTAVRASTVLDMDSVKKQLAGEDVSGGQVAAGAKVIQQASPGERSGYVTDALTYIVGGAALGLLLASLWVVATHRRDPKLRARDEIADAVGIPVVASLRARPPRTAVAWTELLRAYEPDSADGWALRQLLHALVPDAGKGWPTGDPFVLVVLTLSGDSGALPVGPQIAAFAASNGIATHLFAAQQHEAATTLWAACAQASKRQDLPAALSVSTVPDSLAKVELAVRLVVLDRDTPEPDVSAVEGGTAVLAVSSAAVTRRNIADAVVAADRVGLSVQGLVVANPDPLDRTTGRLAPFERPGAAPPRPTAITTRAAAQSNAPAPPPAAAPAGGQRRRAARGRKQR
jgi:capsular polysaccharide biosynthesis protein